MAIPSEVTEYLLPILDDLQESFKRIKMGSELCNTSYEILRQVEKALCYIYENLQQGKILDYKAEMHVINNLYQRSDFK